MNGKENTIRAIQGLLGLPQEEQDGRIGPVTRAAFEALSQPHQITGDWSWLEVRVDGKDLVIGPGIVTAFGGAHDTMDSGETASGLSTKDNPSFLGCALPMKRDATSALRGSPVPKLPWKTTVIFTDLVSGNEVVTKLIDEGPAGWTKHIGDMTEAAAKQFDPRATSNNFERTLSIRVVGGAQYI